MGFAWTVERFVLRPSHAAAGAAVLLALIFALGAGKIALVLHFDVRERGVRLSQFRVELQRLVGRGQRAWKSLAWRYDAEDTEHGVAVREPDVRQRVVGIARDGLVEKFDGSAEALLAGLAALEPAVDVELVSLGIFGVTALETFVRLTGEANGQCFGDPGGDCILHRENVGEFFIELL